MGRFTSLLAALLLSLLFGCAAGSDLGDGQESGSFEEASVAAADSYEEDSIVISPELVNGTGEGDEMAVRSDQERP